MKIKHNGDSCPDCVGVHSLGPEPYGPDIKGTANGERMVERASGLLYLWITNEIPNQPSFCKASHFLHDAPICFTHLLVYFSTHTSLLYRLGLRKDETKKG